MPLFHQNKCNVTISRMDTNKWATTIKNVDIVYYDPPYNKHPYHIYYFLLEIINDWDLSLNIPNTYRGQPKGWTRCKYNSVNKAKETFDDLIKNTDAKYILVSYNNNGIITSDDMIDILNKYGSVELFSFKHGTYNRLLGIAEYKRKNKKKITNEYLYVLKKK